MYSNYVIFYVPYFTTIDSVVTVFSQMEWTFKAVLLFAVEITRKYDGRHSGVMYIPQMHLDISVFSDNNKISLRWGHLLNMYLCMLLHNIPFSGDLTNSLSVFHEDVKKKCDVGVPLDPRPHSPGWGRARAFLPGLPPEVQYPKERGPIHKVSFKQSSWRKTTTSFHINCLFCPPHWEALCRLRARKAHRIRCACLTQVGSAVSWLECVCVCASN